MQAASRRRTIHCSGDCGIRLRKALCDTRRKRQAHPVAMLRDRRLPGYEKERTAPVAKGGRLATRTSPEAADKQSYRGLYAGVDGLGRGGLHSRPAQSAPYAPCREDCLAFRESRVRELPARRPGKKLPERETALLILISQGKILFEKRLPAGVWASLWSFPEMTDSEDARILQPPFQHGSKTTSAHG